MGAQGHDALLQLPIGQADLLVLPSRFCQLITPYDSSKQFL